MNPPSEARSAASTSLLRIRELEAINAQITRHRDQLAKGIEHVICDSPGTPETVKGYLREVLRGEKP